jgi:LEA14-like dessication related protein
MQGIYKTFVVVFCLGLLSACASFPTHYQTPQVTVSSFSLSPQSQGTPVFDIGLRVINPNSVALPLRGMTYQVDIEGHRILSGATADLPRIGAYETADIVIQASPDLLGGLRLFNQLLNSQQQSFNYELKAQLDVGALLPLMTIEEKGAFGLE